MINIAVATTTETRLAEAESIAAACGLPLVHDLHDGNFTYLLVLTPEWIGIQSTKDKHFKPFYLDFSSGKLLYRSQQAGMRKEALARAMGAKPIEGLTIIDATAGLGRDSFILATLGFEVTMLERSPIIHTLLQDAFTRGKADPQIAAIIQRLHLVQADAIDWLKTHQADVVYIDPMFPSRQKSSSVKKEMVILQDLLGKDTDCADLFHSAKACAKKRVVVKRPRLAVNIADLAPNFALIGKSSRFDVYLRHPATEG